VISPTNEDLGLPTGSKIKAHLANAIFSFNVTSPVVAVVDEDFIKDEKIIIPKGTQFIGDAGILKSRDRINVRFSVMVLPGGKEIKVNAMALSLDGSGGIKGKVDKQGGKSILKSIGEMVLAAGTVVLGTKDRAVTLEDELRLNAARNLSDDARDGLNQVKIEESISTQAYTPILILFLDPL
jgi:type IV secretory pathway VirB10-like protein